MNKTVVNSNSFVESLHAILPPARMLHVGVGSGAGIMHLWRTWSIESAWLIDANPASLEWLEPLAAECPQWQIKIATLADSAGTANFFHASNPAESGLITPSVLSVLWPNLQEVSNEEHQTVTLDSLVSSNTASFNTDGDWLLVDCLTSLAILRGASKTLQQCSVVWLRTLLTPLSIAENAEQEGSTLPQLQSLLEPLGFRCVHVSECNHPKLGEVIFVRNWRNEHACHVAERQNRVEQIEQQAAEHLQYVHRCEERIQSQQQEIEEMRTRCSAMAQSEQSLHVQISQLGERCDEQVQLAQERQNRILQLTQAMADQATQLQKDKIYSTELLQAQQQKAQELTDCQEKSHLLSKQINEQQTQLQHAQTQLAELQKMLQAQQQGSKLREQHVAEKDTKLRQRDAEITLLTQRQQQINEELVRAEAQIDLITNVLLQEERL